MDRKGIGNGLLFLALGGLMMPNHYYDLPTSSKRHRSGGWGTSTKPKTLDNSMDRARGMKPWVIDGVTIYAGTLKAARKKHALLQYHTP